MTEDKNIFKIIRYKFTQKEFQREFLTHVLQEAKAGNLDNPAIVKTVSFMSDKCIPIMTVNNDTERSCEVITFEPVEHKRHYFELKLDISDPRIDLARGIPDEIQIMDHPLDDEEQLKNSAADNIVSLLQDTTAKAMASSIDKQIATALTESPQEGTESRSILATSLRALPRHAVKLHLTSSLQ